MSAAAQPARQGASLPAGTLALPNRTRNEDFAGTASESPTQLAIRRMRSNKIGMVSLALLTLIFICSFSSSFFEKHWAGRTYDQQNLSGTVVIDGKKTEVVDLEGMPAIGPGLRKVYTFGADALGRDVFMRMLAGGSVSLRVGLGATGLIIAIGTFVGMLGGFYGGRTDKILTYVVDVMIAFPFIIFAIAFSAAISATGHIGPLQADSIMLPILMIGVIGAFGFSRVIRANAKELGAKEYVEAARALGAEDQRILMRHVLPHLVPTIITYFGILLSGTILGEAGLSFLGVGVQPPTPSWGNLIADGQSFYATAWWIAGGGGLMVMLTVLSANLLGEAVEEAFDHKGNR